MPIASVTTPTSFHSARSQFNAGAVSGAYSGQASEKFGQSTVIDFDPGTGTYKLTNRENVSVTVGNSQKLPESTADRLVFRRVDGSLQHDVVITTPTQGGVKFTYSRILGWNILNNGTRDNKFQFGVFGMTTDTVDMPKTGQGSYSIDGAIGANGFDPQTFTAYNFQPNSTGTFSVDFGAGSVQTVLRMLGINEAAPGSAAVDFGSFGGTGTLTAGGPAFSGTFTSTSGSAPIARSAFEGAFFGPAAQEMNYVFHIDTSRIDITGTVSGRKR